MRCGWRKTCKQALLFREKEAKSFVSAVAVFSGERATAESKVFWFFFAKKNCLLSTPLKRANHANVESMPGHLTSRRGTPIYPLCIDAWGTIRPHTQRERKADALGWLETAAPLRDPGLAKAAMDRCWTRSGTRPFSGWCRRSLVDRFPVRRAGRGCSEEDAYSHEKNQDAVLLFRRALRDRAPSPARRFRGRPQLLQFTPLLCNCFSSFGWSRRYRRNFAPAAS